MAGPDLTEDEGHSPFRRGGFIAAAGFLVLVVGFALAVVLSRQGGGSSPGRHATPPPTSATSAPPVAAGCHPTDTSQQIPQTPPAGIEWTVVKSVAVPTSRAAGPLVVNGDVAGCFAHTPTGALIAAWQINIRHLLCDDWKGVTEQQVMPGPGRDAFEKKRATISGDTADPGTYGQLAGYQFVAYTKDTAAIQFVTRFTDGTMQSSVLTVMWSSGDWRQQLQPDGGDSPNSQEVQSLDGFVPWGGV